VVEPGTPPRADRASSAQKSSRPTPARRARSARSCFRTRSSASGRAITHPRSGGASRPSCGPRAGRWTASWVWDAALLVESRRQQEDGPDGGGDHRPVTQLRGSWPATAAPRRRRGPHREQMPLAVKARYADHVIDNSGSREQTEKRVREVYRPSSTTCASARPPPVSPRRNARAAVPRAPVYRSAHPRRTRALGQHSCGTARWSTASWSWCGRPPRPGGSRSVRGAARSPRRWPPRGAAARLEIDAALAATLQERFAGAGSGRDPPGRRARLFDYAGLRAGAPDPAGRVLVVGNSPTAWAADPGRAGRERGGHPTRWRSCSRRRCPSAWRPSREGKTYGALSVLTQVSAGGGARLLGCRPGPSAAAQWTRRCLYLRLLREPPGRSPIRPASGRWCAPHSPAAQEPGQCAGRGLAGVRRERRRQTAARHRSGRRARDLALAEFRPLAASDRRAGPG